MLTVVIQVRWHFTYFLFSLISIFCIKILTKNIHTLKEKKNGAIRGAKYIREAQVKKIPEKRSLNLTVKSLVTLEEPVQHQDGYTSQITGGWGITGDALPNRVAVSEKAFGGVVTRRHCL